MSDGIRALLFVASAVGIGFAIDFWREYKKRRQAERERASEPLPY